MKIGKAKYGSSKKTYFKLGDTDATYRILPPLGDLADDGIWSLYYKIHYGYTNAAGKSRAFESSLVENRKTKMVEVPDAAKERLEKLKATLETAKAKNDKKAIETLHKLVGAPKSRYNLDANHYMNAMDLQGNIGILKLRHKAKQALDDVIRKLRDKNIDPLSIDNGRFFTFSRTGKGNETRFAVALYGIDKEVEDVGTVSVPVVSKLSEDVLSRLSTEAGELQKLFKKPTAEQVEQIVSESDLATGYSPNIDEILGYKTEDAQAVTDDSGGGEEETMDVEAELAQATTKVAAPAAKKAAPAPAPAVEESPEVEAEVVEAAPAPVQKAVAPAPAKKATVSAPQTTADKVADMSDEDFLKSLNL
jgi:hypothetical protein